MGGGAMSRRRAFKTAGAAWISYAVARPRRASAAPPEIALPDNLRVERVDFEAKGIEGWTRVAGQEEVRGAITPRGLDLDEDPAVGAEADAVLGEWGAEEIAAELLQAGIRR